MKRIRLHTAAIFAMAVASLGGAPAFAQTTETASSDVPGQTNPDADLLASEMRFLTQNPRDLRALLSAGEISTRLGDMSAALAFYARAEKVDPGNPRILAGRARVLVEMERPGEALALFQQAERSGLAMADYWSDRALAYDLLGAPHLAQRDYRAALARGRDDETVRRYALSLAVTGNYDEAMRELDPLLRRSDRAAWRARAFILAMRGDHEGAERIARSMMPGNMGAALNPFFRRLPQLSVADKAFAVHFGAMNVTEARRADARLAPAFAAYVPERAPPPAPAMAAAAPAPTPVVAAPQGRNQRQSRRDRGRRPTEVAAVTRARPAMPPREANPLPPPPQYQVPMVQPIPSATPTPTPTPSPTPTPAPVRMAATTATPMPQTPRREAARIATPTPTPTLTPSPAPPPAATQASTPARALPAPDRKPAPAPSSGAGTFDLARQPGSDTVPTESGSSRPIAIASAQPQPPGPPESGQADPVLAAIIGNIVIPPEELAAFEVPVEAPAPVRAAPPATRPVTPATRTSATKPAAAKPATVTPARKAEPKPPPEPRRFWVQVGIGQNIRYLPDTWAKLVKATPAAFKGRSAWWTPLRATNRLLTGPFKTSAEAQVFINTLRKAGVDALPFTSDAGQKVTKLEAK